jgi:hypothetical protein
MTTCYIFFDEGKNMFYLFDEGKNMFYGFLIKKDPYVSYFFADVLYSSTKKNIYNIFFVMNRDFEVNISLAVVLNLVVPLNTSFRIFTLR